MGDQENCQHKLELTSRSRGLTLTMEKIAKSAKANAQGPRKSESLAACHLNR